MRGAQLQRRLFGVVENLSCRCQPVSSSFKSGHRTWQTYADVVELHGGGCWRLLDGMLVRIWQYSRIVRGTDRAVSGSLVSRQGRLDLRSRDCGATLERGPGDVGPTLPTRGVRFFFLFKGLLPKGGIGVFVILKTEVELLVGNAPGPAVERARQCAKSQVPRSHARLQAASAKSSPATALGNKAPRHQQANIRFLHFPDNVTCKPFHLFPPRHIRQSRLPRTPHLTTATAQRNALQMADFATSLANYP